MKRLLAAAFALALGSGAALADQSSYQIPLTGPKAFGGSGGVADEISHAFLAAVGCSSGGSAPTNGPSSAPITYQCWANNSSNPTQINIYDGAQWLNFFQVDNSAHVINIGVSGLVTAGASTNSQIQGAQTLLETVQTGGADWDLSSITYGNNPFSIGGWALMKTRGATPGSQGLVQSGDLLGFIRALGSDGANHQAAADIIFAVDATAALNSMPGVILLRTTQSGSTNPTEAIRIDHNQHIGFGTTSLTNALLNVTTPNQTQLQGFSTFHTGSNSTSSISQYYWNEINVTNDNIFVTPVSNHSSALEIFHNVQSNSGGSKYAISATEIQQATSGNPDGDHIGGSFISIGQAPAGTAGGSQGSLYGLQAQAFGQVSGSTGWLIGSGGEFDATFNTGTSVQNRYGINIVSSGTVQGSSRDAAIELASISSGAQIAFKNGIYLSNLHGGQGLDSSVGTVIAADSSQTIAKFVDLSNITITGVAYATKQTATGTFSTNNCDTTLVNHCLNVIDVSSDNAAGGGSVGQINAFNVTHKVGGATLNSAMITGFFDMEVTAADNGVAACGCYVAVEPWAGTQVSDGGSSTPGSGRGGLWGENTNASLFTGATNWSIVSGNEVNIKIQTGASADSKIGWYILLPSDDAVQGRTINDAAYAFMNNGTSGGFKGGFIASDLFTGKSPISSGGTFLGTQFTSGPYTIAIGLDLTGFQNMTYQIKGKTFGVDGSGNLGAATYSIVNSSLSVTATGLTCGPGFSGSARSTGGIVTTC